MSDLRLQNYCFSLFRVKRQGYFNIILTVIHFAFACAFYLIFHILMILVIIHLNCLVQGNQLARQLLLAVYQHPLLADVVVFAKA